MAVICLGVLVAAALMLVGWAAVCGCVSGEAERRALWQCVVECPLREEDGEGPPCADPACPWRADLPGGRPWS